MRCRFFLLYDCRWLKLFFSQDVRTSNFRIAMRRLINSAIENNVYNCVTNIESLWINMEIRIELSGKGDNYER